MSKTYPLKIVNVGGDSCTLMSRGHHNFNAFMLSCKERYPSWKMSQPEHLWCKTIPCNNGEYGSLYVFVEEGSRGAWPATYTWEAYGEDTYKYE